MRLPQPRGSVVLSGFLLLPFAQSAAPSTTALTGPLSQYIRPGCPQWSESKSTASSSRPTFYLVAER
eukprot:278094-Lingulodinium_polyedra.AAC.1